jgi:hypothetical protein
MADSLKMNEERLKELGLLILLSQISGNSCLGSSFKIRSLMISLQTLGFLFLCFFGQVF